MKNNELLTIEIPQYIKYVKLSNKRRAKYYTTESKIPKRYQKYKFNAKGILVDPMGNPIIANSKSVDKPRMKKINGQDFYRGMGSHHIRSKIVHEIKNYFKGYVKNLPKIDKFPVKVEMEIHDTPESQLYDLDNLWIYNKCMQDVLVTEGILPEDNFLYITKPGAPEFTPVDSEDNRKMVFRILHDDRKVIKENEVYKKMHEKVDCEF